MPAWGRAIRSISACNSSAVIARARPQFARAIGAGNQLSDEEARTYQAGLAELEAEEWAERRPAMERLRPLQEQLREISARNQQLAQEETALRVLIAELERNDLAVTGEPLGLEL
jgi:microcompartment protein CcmL/EutN